MSKSNSQFSTMFGALMMAGNRFGVAVMTLAANYAIPPDAPHVLVIDPAGARNVTLPAAPEVGDWFLLINAANAAEIITLQDSAGGALTPAITPTQNESVLVVYTGTTFGWRGMVMLGA